MPERTSAIQVNVRIAGRSRVLMAQMSRGSSERGNSAMPQRTRGMKLLR